MHRAIAWFASNSVAANLALLLILAGGLITAPRVKREIFPEIEIARITVSVRYLGAAPAEVEAAICVRIEEQLRGVEGIKQIRSTADEGVGVVTAELTSDADPRAILDRIKARVDAIDTFPEEAEKPVIQQVAFRMRVISIAIAGDAGERMLKHLGRKVRDDLAALPGITHVELTNCRPDEVSIEVSEEALRRHGLTFDAVASAVRRASLDLPGGSIRSDGGEILIRTKGQAYRGYEFEQLVLMSGRDGTRLQLGDVATVVDGFAETDRWARLDGKLAVVVEVYRVGRQSAITVSEAVKEYVRDAQAHMPEGISLIVWRDGAQMLRGRLDTLLHNGRDGFLLVLVVLALFLRLRVAFWVLMGVPLCFLGTLWLMPLFDISINSNSLFAFILVLGMLVDDAIVVGENIYTHQQRAGGALRAAISGAQAVAVPVTFGVLTTMAAFGPILNLPGPMGKLMWDIPVCVLIALAFSLFASMFILPAHLAHGVGGASRRPRNPFSRAWERVQGVVADALMWFIDHVYRPGLAVSLQWRYLTVAVAVATLLLTVGLVGGRWIHFTFLPPVEADRAMAHLTMPQGTPVRVTAAALAQIEAAARRVAAEIEDSNGRRAVGHVMTSIGEQPGRARHGSLLETAVATGAHLGRVTVGLVPSEERSVTSAEVMRRWRDATGPIPGAVELAFSSSIISSGEPINVQLQSADIEALREAAGELKAHLGQYPGVVDITDSFRGGKQELKMRILPSAEALGLTLADLGRQVRQAFYGEEVQRIQRGRDEVRVMVRYPAEQRRSLGDIESMRIRAPDGTEVPFSAVAEVDIGRGFATIQRADRRRIINVTTDVDPDRANANEIVDVLRSSFLPRLKAEHPGLSYRFEGAQREQTEILGALGRGFLIAVLAIYALLAVPLRSYSQPLIIMSAIPFGMVGAVWGHLVLGLDLSMSSIMGLVALSGVVVNDTLVLVSYVNDCRAAGMPPAMALREAGAARFRPILLTSLTTFAGLTPLMLARSVQAQFIIPMAVSLAFGVVFATFVSLVMVPATYLILEDAKSFSARLLGRVTPVTPEGEGVSLSSRPDS